MGFAVRSAHPTPTSITLLTSLPRTSSATSSAPAAARAKPRNRNASHPVHAILNYAYAVLESQVRTQVLAQGFDPTIGILHASKPDRAAFVLDLMEPLRPIVDRKVLEFVQAHTFHPADFTIRTDGVCRLNPELARRVIAVTGRFSEDSKNRISMNRLYIGTS